MRIRSAAFRRYVSLLGIACFLLPFVSVTECKTKAVTGYSGYELLYRDGGWIYLVPVVTASILFASSFSKRKWSLPFSGFSSAGACVLSCLSFASVVFFPEVQFLFDEVRPRVGQILCSLCWAVLYAACAAAAFTIYRMMRRAGDASAVSGIRLLPWTILLVLFGLGLFVIPGVMLAHDSAKEWIPAFAAVTLFLSVPGFVMLYFLRAAVSRGFRWGKALSLVCAGCLLLSAVLFAWSRSSS